LELRLAASVRTPFAVSSVAWCGRTGAPSQHLDPEVGLADKGTATRLARELQGLPSASSRRELLMIGSQTFAARI
jgi:hypothetical protein